MKNNKNVNSHHKNPHESHGNEPKPVNSSQALQNSSTQPYINQPKFSLNYDQVLPPKYENVQYKEPIQNYNALETIRNKTIINDVITKETITEPVKYLKPIYKEVVLKENPQDVRVVKNKTIYLNPGDPLPDFGNIESNPSVVAQNYEEAHNLLHDAGLTSSTMPKAKVTKVSKETDVTQSNYPMNTPQQIPNNGPDSLNTLGERQIFQMGAGDEVGKQSKAQFNSGSSFPAKFTGTQAHSTYNEMIGMTGQPSVYPPVNNSQPIQYTHSSDIGKYEPTMNVTKQTGYEPTMNITKQTGGKTDFMNTSQPPSFEDSMKNYQQTNNELNIPMVNSVEVTPGKSSFPVGTGGNQPTTSVFQNPNPFENPFSTVKGERPSDPLNFPSAVKESKFVSKSSANTFKKK